MCVHILLLLTFLIVPPDSLAGKHKSNDSSIFPSPKRRRLDSGEVVSGEVAERSEVAELSEEVDGI